MDCDFKDKIPVSVMINKFRKLKGLYDYRRQILGLVNNRNHETKQNLLLEKYGIGKLPAVKPRDFFSLFPRTEGDDTLTITSDFSYGISPENDYYFLCRIAKANKVKRYFEIGTWLGLSARNISDNLGDDAEIFSLDIPYDHPEIAIFEIPEHIFGYYAKEKQNVTFLKSDSKVFNFSEFQKSIDFIFIDGNHSQEYVENDTHIALELMRNDNSIIAWHDYILVGELNKNVLCGILNTIPQHLHKHIIYLQQSNLALYSPSFNFIPFEEKKWDIPESTFTIRMTLKT